MSRYLCDMARGPSGRLVVDVDPEFKRQLHSALAAEGLSFKDWVLRQSRAFLAEHKQPSLPALRPYEPDVSLALVADEPATYRAKSASSEKSNHP